MYISQTRLLYSESLNIFVSIIDPQKLTFIL
jgi:hypothetical protein